MISVFYGGPMHGRSANHEEPVIFGLLPPTHNHLRVPDWNRRPQCLEQREIEALTGRTYEREPPRMIGEEWEIEQMRARPYRLYVFCLDYHRKIYRGVYMWDGFTPDNVPAATIENLIRETVR